MYLWHVLSRDNTELIRRVYETQKLSCKKGDSVQLIEADKKELEIVLNDEEIQGLQKETFRKYVKSKVRIKYRRYLNEIKRTHSKSNYLVCRKLEMAEYLNNPRFNTRQKQLLFKLRSRTLDVKCNFRGQFIDLWCISCGLFPESQSHILQCPELVTKLNYLAGKTSCLNENCIYGDIEEQLKIVNIYSDLLEEREKLKEKSD